MTPKPTKNSTASSRTRRSKKEEVTPNNEEPMTVINPNNENQMEIGYGTGWIDIKASTVVSLHETLVVQHNNGPVQLRVDITADFNSIPVEYHEIFLNVLSSRYLGRVNFGDNPFSMCKPVQKRKWYQFWKSKYFTL
jgi:hypothetical protein